MEQEIKEAMGMGSPQLQPEPEPEPQLRRVWGLVRKKFINIRACFFLKFFPTP